MTTKEVFCKLMLVGVATAFAAFAHATDMDHKGRVIAAVQWPMGLLKTPRCSSAVCGMVAGLVAMSFIMRCKGRLTPCSSVSG